MTVFTISDALASASALRERDHAPGMNWPAQVAHLSASSLAMVQRCPEQWRRRYLLGEKRPPGAAAIWGASDHAAHAHNFEQKMASQRDLPLSDVTDAFSTTWDNEVSKRGEVDWNGDNPGEQKDKGIQLAAAYHRFVSPLVQPTTVEAKFARIIKGVPVPLIGFVDVETAELVIERKTTARLERKPKADWRIQGMIYSAERGKDVAFHVSTKTAKPMCYTPANEPGLALARTAGTVVVADAYASSAAFTITALFERYGPDEPWPGALTHPWACGYCGFRPDCSWWEA